MKILLLALGNDVAGDDGVGFLVADIVERTLPRDVAKHVKIVKSSETGLYLLDYFLSGYTHVVIVDSIVSDPPGRILEIPVETLKPALAPSPHYSGIPEILSLLDRLNLRKPMIRIFAITIRRPTLGVGISEPVRRAAARLARRLVSLLIGFVYGGERDVLRVSG